MMDSRFAKRCLGSTGLRVTPLGLGGAWLGHTRNGLNEDTAVATVLRALDLGISLIDTSPAYIRGTSEVFIGKALEEWFRRGGRREDIVISTKTGTRTRPADYSGDGTKRSVEKSLNSLKVDYIDVLLVHDPGDLTPVIAPGGALEVLRELKEEELVRSIGLGVRSHEFHRRLIEAGDCEVSLTYGDFNLLDQSAAEGVLKTAASYNVGVFNGMAIDYGLLSGRDPLQVERRHSRTDRAQRAHELWKWTQALGINLLALALQFCLRETRISSTLVGAANPEEVESDTSAVFEEIPESVWQELPEHLEAMGS